MVKNTIYSQAIIIEDRFTEKISHRQNIFYQAIFYVENGWFLYFLRCNNMGKRLWSRS